MPMRHSRTLRGKHLYMRRVSSGISSMEARERVNGVVVVVVVVDDILVVGKVV